MRLLVTGSREWDNYPLTVQVLTEFIWRKGALLDAVLVHGDCPTGLDRMAGRIWTILGRPVETHPADWETHGKAAGPIRNKLMVELGADYCIGFFKEGAVNRGTRNCYSLARKAGIDGREVWG